MAAMGGVMIGGTPIQAGMTQQQPMMVQQPQFQPMMVQQPQIQPMMVQQPQFQPMTIQQPQVQPMVIQAQVQPVQPIAVQGTVQSPTLQVQLPTNMQGAAIQQVPVVPATVSGGVIQPYQQPMGTQVITFQPQQLQGSTGQPYIINTGTLQPMPQIMTDPYGYQDQYQGVYYQDNLQYDYGYDDGQDYGYDDGYDYDDGGDYGGYVMQPPQQPPQPIVITNNNNNSSRGSEGTRGPIVVRMNQRKKKPRPRPQPPPPPPEPSYTIIKKVVKEKSRRKHHSSSDSDDDGGLSPADLKILRKLKL